MHKLFNSTFELSLRILLMLLEDGGKGMTVDRILAFDFISIYGRNFGISNTSLHGENNFGFSEFASRRQVIQEALKLLALDGLLNIQQRNTGFNYSINEVGKAYCEKLTAEYAIDYRRMTKKTIMQYGYLDDTDLLKIVTNESKKSLRR